MTPRPRSHHQPPAWTARSAPIRVPRRRNDINLEILDDEGILVAPDGGIHRLNSTALLVWEFCNGRTTTLQIADRLSRVYRIDADTALDHVEETVAAFAQLDLFTTADAEDEASTEPNADPSTAPEAES
jgi:hypothetical protein